MQKKSFPSKRESIYSNQNVSLLSNHFSITFKKDIIIQMYKVEIVSRKSLENQEYEEIPKDSHFLKDQVMNTLKRKLSDFFQVYAVQGWNFYGISQNPVDQKNKNNEI